ncbi:MAG: hypothetical protein HYU97_10265 [Deltaproteobacteria bacterium]|nr:hypothetical protein [Deltaproteobacteria bacterium]
MELKQIKFCSVFILLLFLSLLAGCSSGSDAPFSLGSKVPPPTPFANPDEIPGGGGAVPTPTPTGGGATGCVVQLTGGNLDLKVDAHMPGRDPLVKLDAQPVDIPSLPLHFDGNQVTLLGSEFPEIRLTELSADRDLIVHGNVAGNVATGTFDPSTGQIELKDFRFVVQILSSKEAGASNVGDPIVFPKTILKTTEITATGNGNPITVQGKPLDSQTKEVALAAGLTIPVGTLLDAGDIGGGALTAVFTGAFDKLPNDPNCVGGGTVVGEPDFAIKMMVGEEEQDIGGNTLDFGEKFAGGLEEKVFHLRIKNLGTADLTLNKITQAVGGPIGLLKEDGAQLITPVQIAGGSNFDFRVEFKPTAADLNGQDKSYSVPLTFENNDPQTPTYTLTLKGKALAPAPKLSLTVLEKNEATGSYAFVEKDTVDFGAVFFPTNQVVPEKLYRFFRIYNLGVLDLPMASMKLTMKDFTFGAIRYGYNTAKDCASDKSPVVGADNCSILINKKLLDADSDDDQVVNLPPADLNDLEHSIHLDVIVGYQPSTHEELATGKFIIKANGVSDQQIQVVGHVDANTKAKVILYFDTTPDNAEDVENEIAVLTGQIFNFKRNNQNSSTAKIYVANGGAEGGDLLQVDPSKLTLEGDAAFTISTDGFDEKLLQGISVVEGKKFLGTLTVNKPSSVIPYKKATLKLKAKSVKSEGGNASDIEDFTSTVFYGLPESDNLTLFVSFAIGAIDNKDLIDKPTHTEPNDPLGSIPIKIQLSGEPGGIIVGKQSTQPKFEGAPACTGTPAQQKACASAMAPTRLITTSLGGPSNTCHEGDYDGLYESGECSYFAISFAGKEGTNYPQGVIADTKLTDSVFKIDLQTGKAQLLFKNVLIRFMNTEHNLMTGNGTHFDHILPITFTTGVLGSEVSGYDESAYPLLSKVNINQPPMRPFICDGNDSDGNNNTGDCIVPEGLPDGAGVLVGRDWNLQTGEVTLVGVTRIDQQSQQNDNDAFFAILGERYFYMVLQGKICGDAIGIQCK